MQRLCDQREIVTEIAYVMINCESGTELKVMEDLKTIDCIKEIVCTFGSHDIVTKIEARSAEFLRDIITSEIRKLEGVRSTTTLICK